MRKTQTTKNALLSSILALALCCAMLIGSTFAWFTDSVSSDKNLIAAGNLDVALYHTNQAETDKEVTGSTVLFNGVDSDKWEPGAIAWEKLTVKNEGNLKLKYKLILNALNASVIDGISFASMLKVAVVDDSFVYTRENVMALDASAWSDLSSFSKTGELAEGESAVYGIIIFWQPSANDNVFNMNNGKNDVAKVDISVSLLATQATNEEDSFGTDYDAGAELPLISSAPQTLPTAGTPAEDMTFSAAGENPVNATLPAEIVESLAGDNVTSATLKVATPTFDTAAKTITFSEIAFYDQNGEKIDLSNNRTPILVQALVGKDLAGETVSVFHDGAFVATAEVDAEGYITYEALHFCEVTVEVGAGYEYVADGVYKNGDAYYLNSTAGLAWMNEHADDDAKSNNFLPFFAGKTIYLMNDIDCEGFEMKATRFFQAEERTVFDGQGYTLYNVDISTAPNESSQAIFNGTVDIKNLNVDGAWIQGYGYTAVLGGTLYGNIENCTVKNAQVFGSYWMTGVLAAQFNSGNIKGCTVENCEVYSPSAAGALVGNINETAGVRKIEDCVVKNCAISQNGGFGGDYDLFFNVGVGLININNSEIHFNNVKLEGENTVKGTASTSLYSLPDSNTIYENGNVVYTPVAATSLDDDIVPEPTPLA